MINAPRLWLERELKLFAGRLEPGALVLDAGAGRQPYRKLFDHCRYESTDFEQVDKQYASSTYVCDLSAIPVEDGRFDAVIFTQVMEHLPDPAVVLRELRRVMRPGGLLFYTGPLVYEEHEVPYDFYRYTQFGVRHLLTINNFAIDEVRPLDGTMATIAHQLRFVFRNLPWKPGDYAPGISGVLFTLAFTPFRPMARMMAGLAARSAAKSRYCEGGMPMNYLAIARVPEK